MLNSTSVLQLLKLTVKSYIIKVDNAHLVYQKEKFKITALSINPICFIECLL